MTRFASLRGGTTKQSRQYANHLDCFAPLAMTTAKQQLNNQQLNNDKNPNRLFRR